MITASMSAASRADAPVIQPVVIAASQTASLAAQVAKPNPSSQLDLTLGITVLTFHDASGQVVATTPTRQQLNTYLLFGTSQHTAAKSVGAADNGSAMAMLA